MLKIRRSRYGYHMVIRRHLYIETPHGKISSMKMTAVKQLMIYFQEHACNVTKVRGWGWGGGVIRTSVLETWAHFVTQYIIIICTFEIMMH